MHLYKSDLVLPLLGPALTSLGTTLDVSGLATEAFSVPRDGNISAISASFTAASAAPTTFGAGVAATITAQVYRAPAGSTIFTATNAVVTLAPSFTGPLAVQSNIFCFSKCCPYPSSTG